MGSLVGKEGSSLIKLSINWFRGFRRIVKIVMLGCIVGSVAFFSSANNIKHINIGRIAVDDQSIRSQQIAGKLALGQVFIKLSGNKNVAKETQIARAIDNYEQFLVSSSFVQQDDTLVFEATFNQAKAENLLLASGLSVWASLRPSATLWLATEDANKQKELLSQYSDSARVQKIGLKAFARGVDIISPLGDLQDNINVSVYDVWNQFISKLQDQSIRYDTDYLISATVQTFEEQAAKRYESGNTAFYNSETRAPGENKTTISNSSLDALQNTHVAISPDQQNQTSDNESATNNSVEADRALTIKRAVETTIPDGTTHKLDYVITHVDSVVSKKVEIGRIYGKSEEDVVLNLVDVYADILAKEFASSTPLGAVEQSIKLNISGIDSLEDYVNMMTLLNSVPSINNVNLVKQFRDSTLLNVELRISVSQLKSILSLDDRFNAGTGDTNADLSLRWQGE